MSEQNEYFYVVGVGGSEDWEADRGSLHWIEADNGERVMLVFTSPEKAEAYVRANLHSPQAHMQMLEGLLISHVPPLTEGRLSVLRLDAHTLIEMALSIDITCLVRDPRPGAQQEIIRLDD
jgi:hypothetical protein